MKKQKIIQIFLTFILTRWRDYVIINLVNHRFIRFENLEVFFMKMVFAIVNNDENVFIGKKNYVPETQYNERGVMKIADNLRMMYFVVDVVVSVDESHFMSFVFFGAVQEDSLHDYFCPCPETTFIFVFVNVGQNT